MLGRTQALAGTTATLRVAILAVWVTCSSPTQTASPPHLRGGGSSRLCALRGDATAGGAAMLHPADGPALRDALLEGALGPIEVLLRTGTYEVEDESLVVPRRLRLAGQGSGEGVNLLAGLVTGVEGCEECTVEGIGRWESPRQCCLGAEGGVWELEGCVMSVEGFGDEQAACVVEVLGDARVGMRGCSVVGRWKGHGDSIDVCDPLNAHGVRACGDGSATLQGCTLMGLLIAVCAVERSHVALRRCDWNKTSVCVGLEGKAKVLFEGGTMSCVTDGALFAWDGTVAVQGFEGVGLEGDVWADKSLYKGVGGVGGEHAMQDDEGGAMRLVRDERVREEDGEEPSSSDDAGGEAEGEGADAGGPRSGEVAEGRNATPQGDAAEAEGVDERTDKDWQLERDIEALVNLPQGAPKEELEYLIQQLEPYAAVIPRIAELVAKARELQGRKENDLEWLYEQAGIRRDLNVSWPYEDELPDDYRIILEKMRNEGEEVPPVIPRPSPEQQERDMLSSSFGDAWREILAMEKRMNDTQRLFEEGKANLTQAVRRWAGEEDAASTPPKAPKTTVHSLSKGKAPETPRAVAAGRTMSTPDAKGSSNSRSGQGGGAGHASSAGSAAAGLPPGWVVKKSQSSGKSYYMHVPTGKTQWTRP